MRLIIAAALAAAAFVARTIAAAAARAVPAPAFSLAAAARECQLLAGIIRVFRMHLHDGAGHRIHHSSLIGKSGR